APTVANPIADVTVYLDAPPPPSSTPIVFAALFRATNSDALTYSVTSSDGSLVTASISDTDLSLHYLADQNGTAIITVTATDSNGPVAVADPFTVTVNPINDAPTVANPIADVTVDEDAAPTVIDIANVFADVDIATNSDSLTYSATSSNGTLVTASISGTSLTLTYAADQNGSATITVTATDANGPLAVADLFIVTVTPYNDVPTTSGIADVTVAEDAANTAINLFAAFADNEDADSALTYTVVDNTNSGLFNSTTIDAAGTLVLNYAANQNGSSLITIRATDTGGLWVETTFNVTVTPVNDAPTGIVTINGTPIEAQTLTATNSLNDA
ncbi:MAG: polysaccharide deacetylase, partial [Desulfuromusa sp.]|nr:polysaccharide deacetylase [Desulfuromusa sp.]